MGSCPKTGGRIKKNIVIVVDIMVNASGSWPENKFTVPHHTIKAKRAMLRWFKKVPPETLLLAKKFIPIQISYMIIFIITVQTTHSILLESRILMIHELCQVTKQSSTFNIPNTLRETTIYPVSKNSKKNTSFNLIEWKYIK